MSDLDNCGEENKGMLRHFKLPKKEGFCLTTLYCSAILDAVVQILLLIILTTVWILSILYGDIIAFGVVSAFSLMGDAVCGLQLLLALLMVHACAKKKLKYVESSILWIGVHLFFLIVIIFLYTDMEKIVLVIIQIYLTFRIIQIVLLLGFRNQILHRKNYKLTVDESLACNLQFDLIRVAQEQANNKIYF